MFPLQPERIDPSASRQGYDVRSDVWSLGITLVSPGESESPARCVLMHGLTLRVLCVSVPVRAGHRPLPLPQVEQRVRPADSGGEGRPAAAQQLRGETLLPQVHLLCQRVVSAELKHVHSLLLLQSAAPSAGQGSELHLSPHMLCVCPCSLTKDESKRPKYRELLVSPCARKWNMQTLRWRVFHARPFSFPHPERPVHPDVRGALGGRGRLRLQHPGPDAGVSQLAVVHGLRAGRLLSRTRASQKHQKKRGNTNTNKQKKSESMCKFAWFLDLSVGRKL